jgi:hypothetical protein
MLKWIQKYFVKIDDDDEGDDDDPPVSELTK